MQSSKSSSCVLTIGELCIVNFDSRVVDSYTQVGCKVVEPILKSLSDNCLWINKEKWRTMGKQVMEEEKMEQWLKSLQTYGMRRYYHVVNIQDDWFAMVHRRIQHFAIASSIFRGQAGKIKWQRICKHFPRLQHSLITFCKISFGSIVYYGRIWRTSGWKIATKTSQKDILVNLNCSKTVLFLHFSQKLVVLTMKRDTDWFSNENNFSSLLRRCSLWRHAGIAPLFRNQTSTPAVKATFDFSVGWVCAIILEPTKEWNRR